MIYVWMHCILCITLLAFCCIIITLVTYKITIIERYVCSSIVVSSFNPRKNFQESIVVGISVHWYAFVFVCYREHSFQSICIYTTHTFYFIVFPFLRFLFFFLFVRVSRYRTLKILCKTIIIVIIIIIAYLYRFHRIAVQIEHDQGSTLRVEHLRIARCYRPLSGAGQLFLVPFQTHGDILVVHEVR